MKKIINLLYLLHFLLFTSTSAHAFDRFQIQGSGKINLQNGSKSFSGIFRSDGKYDEQALKKINAVYGSSFENPAHQMSLRFLELLSFIQDHFSGAKVVIKSGYRSPTLNQQLRNIGKLAAQSSMHKEAAAADFYLQGISAETLRDFAQSLSCCGVGYYHGKHIHLDIGPKRWWDETNSGTEKKEPQENEKIIALIQYDFYKPKEKISFDFARITEYPVGYDLNIIIEKKNQEKWVNISESKLTQTKLISKYEEQKNISLVEAPMKAGTYRLKILLDNKQWPKMPTELYSNSFEVLHD